MRRRRDERGFTIAEMSVVVMLGSIAMFITLNFLDNTSLIVSRSTSSVRTESDARLAMRTMLQDIRAAQDISQTYPTSSTCPTGTNYPAGYSSCLQFSVLHTTSSTSSCPYSRVTYGLVNKVVKEDRVDYDSNCTPKTVFTGKTILSNVTNTSSKPLFSYYDQYGNAVSTSTGTAAQFADSGTINVQVNLQFDKRASDLAIFSSAALRNNR